jgi:hypothetical protein
MLPRPALLRSALRDPLAQFLLAGALLVAVQRATTARRAPDADGENRRIVVDAAFVEAVSRNAERAAGRPLDEAQRARWVADAVDEEILFREAKAMHLDADDAIVRRRLVQKAEFLLDDLRPIPEPTDAQLETYLAAHAETYRSPLKLSFRHIFFSSAGRGADAERDAERALDRLTLDPGAKVTADVFLAGASFEERSLRDIDGLLGSGVGDAIAAQPLGRWSGPVRSAYGVHDVRVESRREPTVPPLAQVRAQVRQALIDERRENDRRDARAALRTRYVIDDRGGWNAPTPAHAMNDVTR